MMRKTPLFLIAGSAAMLLAGCGTGGGVLGLRPAR